MKARTNSETSQFIFCSGMFSPFEKDDEQNIDKILRKIHEFTLILPELFLENEGGDTDDNIKRESSGVGQCTNRLLHPNASRPNHNVFDVRKQSLQ